MGISKRLEEARSGYKKGDKSLSAKAHDIEAIRAAAREHHGGKGSQYLGDLVYGGLDGIITTFAVVSGVAGARLDPSVILILGLANLFADGVSMATGAYLSEKSDHEYYERERQREAWEVENYPEGERAELEELYISQGYSPEDAKTLVDIKSKEKKLWVDAMMVEELGMLKSDKKPFLSALSTLVAFIIAGAVPLLVYLFGLLSDVASNIEFLLSFILTGFALFGLGAAKVLVTQRNWFKSGLEMLVVGGLAAGVAYVVGALLRGIAG